MKTKIQKSFDSIAAELDASSSAVKEENRGVVQQQLDVSHLDKDTIQKSIVTGVMSGLTNIFKGGYAVDKNSKTLDTETCDDPAEKPVKSGGGYKDTKKYVSKGSEGMEDDEDDDDEDDEDDDDEVPAYFSKSRRAPKRRTRQRVRKSRRADENDVGEEEFDVTEEMNYFADQIHRISKSLKTQEKVFSRVLRAMDAQSGESESRDNLMVSIAKSLNNLNGEVKTIKKSFATPTPQIAGHNMSQHMTDFHNQAAINKSMPAQIPAQNNNNNGQTTPFRKGALGNYRLNPNVRNDIMKAQMMGKISAEEANQMRSTGDTSLLNSRT